jgi:hypothetical protein
MRYQSIKQIAGLGLVFAALAFPSLSRADDTIHSGWDLFVTDPLSSVLGVSFVGVPLGTFDFGGSIGVQNVGNVDTIIQRPNNIVGSGNNYPYFTATLVAWQLRSANPTDFGGIFGSIPYAYYYLTLDNNYTSGDTANWITFNPGGTNGTFGDTLEVHFAMRYGSLTGPVVWNSSCTLVNTWATWSREGSYPIVIDGVNHLLNGTDTSEDFWVNTIIHVSGGGEYIHIVPEPSVCSLAVCLGGGLMGLWRMRRKLLRK